MLMLSTWITGKEVDFYFLGQSHYFVLQWPSDFEHIVLNVVKYSLHCYLWLMCPCFPAGITVNLTWGRPSPRRTAALGFWTTRASFPASPARGSTGSAAVRPRDSPPASREPGYRPLPPSHAGTPWARGGSQSPRPQTTLWVSAEEGTAPLQWTLPWFNNGAMLSW